MTILQLKYALAIAGSSSMKQQVQKQTGLVNLFVPTTVSYAEQKEMGRMVNLLNKLKPDAFIGVSDWAAKLGIPATHVQDGKRPTMGYAGLLSLGNKIADQLENPGFNKKLAKHIKLSYKEIMDLWPEYIIRMYAGLLECASSLFILLCMVWSARGL